jgi:hypothetical protein
MSNPKSSATNHDDEQDGNSADEAARPVPDASKGEPDAGDTTGAEQAAANRENDPPA